MEKNREVQVKQHSNFQFLCELGKPWKDSLRQIFLSPNLNLWMKLLWGIYTRLATFQTFPRILRIFNELI